MLILLDGMSRGFNYVKGLNRHYSRSTPFSFELIWTWHRVLYRALRIKEIQDSETTNGVHAPPPYLEQGSPQLIYTTAFGPAAVHERISVVRYLRSQGLQRYDAGKAPTKLNINQSTAWEYADP